MSKEKYPSHHQQTGVARALLIIVLAILSAGNYAFWEFSRYRANPFPAMPGLVVGSILATLLMVGAIWMRKPMARTALVIFIWLMMFAFAMPGLILMSDRVTAQIDQLQMLAAGLVAYLVSNIILIVSAPIHRLGASRGCRS